MAIYPTYTVAGVKMDDPSGRWELVHGTAILPSFPGRKVVQWDLPGMVGSQSAAYAPGEAMIVPIKLRVNAVAQFANTIVSGGVDKKTIAIRDNLDRLFHAIGLARQGYQGMVEIRRYASGADYRRAAGRIISASEPSWDAYADHAEITLLFECPAGAWGSPNMDVTTATILKSKTSTRIAVPAGTAPSLENMICIKAPSKINSTQGARIGVWNAASVGFNVGVAGAGVTVPANTWIMINTLYWKYGFTTDGKAWGTSKPNTGLIEPKGRPTGSALTILPSPVSGTGYVYVWSPVPNAQVIIRSRKMWY